jgi:hypothetical protein
LEESSAGDIAESKTIDTHHLAALAAASSRFY